MLQRPWPIIVIAVLHILAPLSNFFLSAGLLHLGPADYVALQMRHQPLFLLLWVLLPIFAGLALLTFRMWSYYLFLGFMVLVSIYTLRQRLLYPYRVNLWLFLLMELINFAVIIYFLSPAARGIYFNKRIRWWQQRPRFQVILLCRICKAGEWVSAKIENISKGGVFVTGAPHLVLKDEIEIQFELLGEKIQTKGIIVHNRDNGFGVLFNSETFGTNWAMRRLIRKLYKGGYPMRSRPLSVKESFVQWFKDLMSTGQGVFPDQSPNQKPNKTEN